MTAKVMMVCSLVVGMALVASCDRSQHELMARQQALAEAEPVGEEAEEVVVHADPEPAVAVFDDVPVASRDADWDRDGFAGREDSDDRDPFTYPGAPEHLCDGVDQDGDGVDECPPDEDGDGIRASADCDDHDPMVSPRALEELCNGIDENCSGRDECDSDGDRVEDLYDLDPDGPAVGVPEVPSETESL